MTQCVICKCGLSQPADIFGPRDIPQCRRCWLAVGLNSVLDRQYYDKAADLYPDEANDPYLIAPHVDQAREEARSWIDYYD